MKRHILLAGAAFALSLPATAQEAEPAEGQEPAPSPNQIVETAPDEEWVTIPAEDLVVMTLAADAEGNTHEVIIQLMPAPFSQGWVENIRTFARAGWYDNISINRVQDNYVVQWGDPNYDNPEAEGETKALPEGLKVMDESEYSATAVSARRLGQAVTAGNWLRIGKKGTPPPPPPLDKQWDVYAAYAGFSQGWPVAGLRNDVWPVHCYGMVGVGRSYSPDTGSGAELYTVIGHAPRHLDRNIALVGRIISGMEHLTSLPRGSGALGFYAEEEEDKRTPILTVRVAIDLPDMQQPLFEYLSTESETFAKYADARANRRDPFFIHPAGGADICNIPVPIRPTPNG